MYRDTKFLSYWREFEAALHSLGKEPNQLAIARLGWRANLPAYDLAYWLG